MPRAERPRRPRRVTWRATTIAHAFVELSGLSACGKVRISETKNWEGEDLCRACEIAMEETW